LHAVRKTIEQYSNEGTREVPEDIDERGGSVGGVGYRARPSSMLEIKVEGGWMPGVWYVDSLE
jgi:hypothetical protein